MSTLVFQKFSGGPTWNGFVMEIDHRKAGGHPTIELIVVEEIRTRAFSKLH
jgi:hypothetical protein